MQTTQLLTKQQAQACMDILAAAKGILWDGTGDPDSYAATTGRFVCIALSYACPSAFSSLARSDAYNTTTSYIESVLKQAGAHTYEEYLYATGKVERLYDHPANQHHRRLWIAEMIEMYREIRDVAEA